MSVSSPHLQLALQSRKSGQFPEALSHLVNACNANDHLALFYMADAYEYGGWGLERDFQKAFIYARRAHKAGCKYGTYMYGDKMHDEDLQAQGLKSPFIRECIDEITPEIQAEADNGDGVCQAFVSMIMIGKSKSAHLIDASLKQCVYQAYLITGLYYYASKKNFKVGIVYLKKAGEESAIFESVGESTDSKEYYAFGWALAKGILKDDDFNTHRAFLAVYYSTYDRASEALTAWFIICKRGIFPGNRDLVKLIAQYVLKFAEDPEVWGI